MSARKIYNTYQNLQKQLQIRVPNETRSREMLQSDFLKDIDVDSHEAEARFKLQKMLFT